MRQKYKDLQMNYRNMEKQVKIIHKQNAAKLYNFQVWNIVSWFVTINFLFSVCFFETKLLRTCGKKQWIEQSGNFNILEVALPV